MKRLVIIPIVTFLGVLGGCLSTANEGAGGDSPPTLICGSISPDSCAPRRTTPSYQAFSIIDGPQELSPVGTISEAALHRFGLISRGELPATGQYCTTASSLFEESDLTPLSTISAASTGQSQRRTSVQGQLSLRSVVSAVGRSLGLTGADQASLGAQFSDDEVVQVDFSGVLQGWEISPVELQGLDSPSASAAQSDCVARLRREPGVGIVAALNVVEIASYSLSSADAERIGGQIGVAVSAAGDDTASVSAQAAAVLTEGISVDVEGSRKIVGYAIWRPDDGRSPIKDPNVTIPENELSVIAWRLAEGEPGANYRVCNRTSRRGPHPDNGSSHDVLVVVDGGDAVLLRGYRNPGSGSSMECREFYVADEIRISRVERDRSLFKPLDVVVYPPGQF